MLPLDVERALRVDAMDWLAAQTDDGAEAVSRETLTQFRFDGERLTLIDTGRGIRKPKICQAALTILTSCTPSSGTRRDEDVLGDDGSAAKGCSASRTGGVAEGVDDLIDRPSRRPCHPGLLSPSRRR